MKKIIYIILILCAISCNNDESLINEDIEQDIEVVKLPRAKSANPDAEDEYVLKFKDETVLNNTISRLEQMSVSDRDKWLETFGGFESLFQIYEKAMSDADSLDFTIDEYKWFKEKYGKFLYFPEYNDDYGAYLPVMNRVEAVIINRNSHVLVGEELLSMDDVKSYGDLQKSGQALYDPENKETETSPTLKSVSSDGFYDKTQINEIGKKDQLFRDKYIGNDQYVSSWKEENKRKIRIKLGRQPELQRASAGTIDFRDYYRVKLHSEITFRKKGFLGKWYNYSSKTEATYDINIVSHKFYPSFGDLSKNFKWISKEEGSSSHDGYIDCPVSIIEKVKINDNGFKYEAYRYYFPTLKGTCTINFRGMSSVIRYDFYLDHQIGLRSEQIHSLYLPSNIYLLYK